MKGRRKPHLHTNKNYDSLPPNSKASVTLSRIQNLEKNNSDLKSKIVDIELKIQKLNRDSEKSDSVDKKDESTNGLKKQISVLSNSIDQLRKQDNEYKEKFKILDDKIKGMNDEYQELLVNNTKYLDLKQKVTSTEQKLKEQKMQIQAIIDNLVVLNKKIISMDAIEWVEQKKNIEQDIEDSNVTVQKKKEEIQYIKQQIADLQSKQDFLKPIVDKWKGKVFSDIMPIESVDELMRKLGNKMKQPPPDTRDLQIHLQEIIKENERKREQILKERKENAKRIRKIQQVLVEVKKQNRETHEKANIEEQRLIQRILALQEDT